MAGFLARIRGGKKLEGRKQMGRHCHVCCVPFISYKSSRARDNVVLEFYPLSGGADKA